jgi:hypothetical protein
VLRSNSRRRGHGPSSVVGRVRGARQPRQCHWPKQRFAMPRSAASSTRWRRWRPRCARSRKSPRRTFFSLHHMPSPLPGFSCGGHRSCAPAHGRIRGHARWQSCGRVVAQSLGYGRGADLKEPNALARFAEREESTSIAEGDHLKANARGCLPHFNSTRSRPPAHATSCGRIPPGNNGAIDARRWRGCSRARE